MRSAHCSVTSNRGWEARAGEFGAEYKVGSVITAAGPVEGSSSRVNGDGGGESNDAIFLGGRLAGGEISFFC